MKNIYEMFNDIETNVEEYESQEFSEFEAKKWQKNMKKQVQKKRFGGKAAVAAACVAVCLLIPFREQVAAAMESATESISKWLTFGTAEKNIASYENVINTSVTDDKIEVKLESVILDEHDVIVSTVQKYPKGRMADFDKMSTVSYQMESDSFEAIRKDFKTQKLNPPKCPCMAMELKIDGKQQKGVVIADPWNEAEDGIRVIYQYYLRDEEPIDFSKKMKVNLELQEVTGISDGKWKFEFEAEGDQIKADTLSVSLDQKVQLPNGKEITLTEFRRNELGAYIYYEGVEKANCHIQLRGENDRGEMVWFSDYGIGESGKGRFELDRLESMRVKDIKNLNLTVYWHELGKKGEDISTGNYKPYGEPFILDVENTAK